MLMSRLNGQLSTIALLLGLGVAACKPVEKEPMQRVFDSQGHRGARGAFPENTIPAFEEALRQNMRTLELDLAVSKYLQLVVSHEPWFNPKICNIE